MIRQLLEEVKAAPLDEASRNRLKEIHQASIKELEAGLAPELVEELERLSLPFTEDGTPVRERAADRPGPAGRLARGPVPRHPDRDLRPADGRPRAARADAQGAASRRGDARRPPGQRARATRTRARARRVRRDVPLAGVSLGRAGRSRTRTRPSRPTITSATPGAASRVRLSGSASSTLVNSAASVRLRRCRRAGCRCRAPARPARRTRRSRGRSRRSRSVVNAAPSLVTKKTYVRSASSCPGRRRSCGEVTTTSAVRTSPL